MSEAPAPNYPLINAPDPEIENWFTYHPPTGDQRLRYEEIREAAKALAYRIRACTPRSADQTAALRKLRECVMTANASIACEAKP